MDGQGIGHQKGNLQFTSLDTAMGVAVVAGLESSGEGAFYRFLEPLKEGFEANFRDSFLVNAPTNLPVHEVYLYAAAFKQRRASGEWKAHLLRYYRTEKDFFESAAARFPDLALTEGQIQGLFRRVKKERKAKGSVASNVRIIDVTLSGVAALAAESEASDDLTRETGGNDQSAKRMVEGVVRAAAGLPAR